MRNIFIFVVLAAGTVGLAAQETGENPWDGYDLQFQPVEERPPEFYSRAIPADERAKSGIYIKVADWEDPFLGELILSQLGLQYPIIVQRINKKYRIFLGPCDEKTGINIVRSLQSMGYPDASIQKGPENPY